ncbi:MAG: GlsB/YeaQ/YmgE family stress response membrane protein [Chloroflexota bacterium]|nr:GlsB/YeaQ/YmgE family stress response membrane protein [Chloroflexota bacterium]
MWALSPGAVGLWALEVGGETAMNFILWIILGIAAGWLAGVITRTDRNIWGDLVLGLIGAFVAGLITDGLVGGDAGFWTSLVTATIAAVVLVLIKNAIFSRD